MQALTAKASVLEMCDCCLKEQLIMVWICSGETHSSDGSSSSAGSCHTPHTAWRGSLLPYLLIKITKTAVAISADQNCHLHQQEGAGHLCLLMSTAGSYMKNLLLTCTLEKEAEMWCTKGTTIAAALWDGPWVVASKQITGKHWDCTEIRCNKNQNNRSVAVMSFSNLARLRFTAVVFYSFCFRF